MGRPKISSIEREPLLVARRRATRRSSPPFGYERKAKGEGKANRNNPEFRILRKSLRTKEKPFSNRNKKASSDRPPLRLTPPKRGARRNLNGL